MRLLNVKTHKLESFLGEVPPYAILSHTWRDGEVTFQDFDGLNGIDGLASKPGWVKILGFLDTLAKRMPDAIEYAWVDTCCIDKTSSAELSEAINAMFLWYKHSECCFAYLDDVQHDGSGPLGEDFEGCRWFDRGWTLQELLAPQNVEFFDHQWCFLGTKFSLAERITRRTNIDEKSLLTGDFATSSVATRMSWAAGRQTTRPEDLAYCLLGIFDINMYMLYGEGEKAFVRLQEEILKEYDDQSIFAWDSSSVPPSITTIGVLATHPSQFRESCGIKPHPSSGGPVTVTNKGIQVDLALVQQQAAPDQLLGLLSCISEGDMASAMGISLVRSSTDGALYSRSRSSPIKLATRTTHFKQERVYLVKRNSSLGREGWATTSWLRYPSAMEPIKSHPAEYWHQSASTETMTMTVPYAACATSKSVFATVTFRIVESGELILMLLDLVPQKRTMSLKLVAVDSIPKGKGPEHMKWLQQVVRDRQADGSTLEVAGGTVVARGTVNLTYGSWVWDFSIKYTPGKGKPLS